MVNARRKAMRKVQSTAETHPERKRFEDEYTNARIDARKTVDEAKRTSWKTFVGGFSSQTATREMWSNFRKIQGRNRTVRINAIASDDHVATNDDEIAENLANAFSMISSDKNYTSQFQKLKAPQILTTANTIRNSQ